MTIFGKRRMNVAEWAKVQDKIGMLLTTMGAPHDLMMFSIDSEDRGDQDIYIGLPNTIPLSGFPGFEQIKREDLPEYMSTLVVREDGFKEAFPDIAAKRNAADRNGRR